MRILLVEDEPYSAARLAELLRHEQYAVDLATDGAAAENFHYLNDYDLIILDWTNPPPNELELLRNWRSSGDNTPVFMVSTHREIEERVRALDSGADDFLVRPFADIEFLARVRSLLRRSDEPLHFTLSNGCVCMDRAAHEVTVGSESIDLPPKEFAVLEYFLNHVDEVVTRTDLIEHVWDDSFDAMSNVVDVAVHRLRSKLDKEQSYTQLQTVKGVGYILKSQSG